MNRCKKIYVLAPYKGKTGGIELAHQLVDYICRNNQEAYIVYVKNGAEIVDCTTVTSEYKNYNIKVTSVIDDAPDNLLVLPEIYFEFIKLYSNIRIACWWMSVDNRYNNASFGDTIKFRRGLKGKIRVIGRLLLQYKSFKKNTNSLLLNEDSRIFHLYQSTYAQHHLYKLGFSKVLPLSDYINTEFETAVTQEREDIILYNPAKGEKFTNSIIKAMPNYKFVGLRGYSRQELIDLMQKSKLYIDFGNFPGKDRLPREVVLNGCCLLTGKAGASFYYEDVAIPENYKIKAVNRNIPEIVNRISYILNHYEECVKDMDFYKQRILSEREVFYKEIENFFFNKTSI